MQSVLCYKLLNYIFIGQAFQWNINSVEIIKERYVPNVIWRCLFSKHNHFLKRMVMVLYCRFVANFNSISLFFGRTTRSSSGQRAVRCQLGWIGKLSSNYYSCNIFPIHKTREHGNYRRAISNYGRKWWKKEISDINPCLKRINTKFIPRTKTSAKISGSKQPL